MKKSVVVIFTIFTIPAFASGIDANSASAPCTNNTLETYSGNTNLAADWAPNTINLRWYNNNTLLTVQSAANTCVYDGTLTIPATEPTRTGYTFAGWQVRPEYNFSTIPIYEHFSERLGKCVVNHQDYCWYDDTGGSAHVIGCDTKEEFKELQQHEWQMKFNHGVLYGMSLCSATNGTYTNPGTPSTTPGSFCWCKATGYQATGTDIIYAPSSALSWICGTDASSISQGCDGICAIWCTSYMQSATFLEALLTPAVN